MHGLFLWGTGHRDMAESLDPSHLCDLPSPWSEALQGLGPWHDAPLAAEGPESVCRRSQKRADRPALFITGACSSTISLAWHFSAMEALPVWGSILSVHQWQGKGQLGRTWISPPGNLYGALRLPDTPPAFSGMTSLVFGYAMVRVLQDMGFPGKLKWPNDIMVDGKKAGGILIQVRNGIAVAGVGINVASSPPPESLRAGHAVAATHLGTRNRSITPLSLWIELLDRGQVFWDELLSGSVPEAISRIQSQMAFMGQPVRVDDHTGTPAYHAILSGLSPDGGLVLKLDNRTETIRSGSIAPLPVNERNGCEREDI